MRSGRAKPTCAPTSSTCTSPPCEARSTNHSAATPSPPCAASATGSKLTAADMRSTEPTRRTLRRWNQLPLRIRLVAGFAAAMLVVLTGAGAFVYLRVRYALDLRLNEDLTAQSNQLVHDVAAHAPPTV